jgi:AcrR family transcriptional regulator
MCPDMSYHSAVPTNSGNATVVRRLLSPAQAATRQKLIEAALALAAEGGYDSAGVREVAARAGVSPATAYQQFGSKDELLVASLFALGDRSTLTVRARRPRGADPAARIIGVFRRIMREVAGKPLLYAAVYRAYVARAAALPLDAYTAFGPEQSAWIADTLRAGDRAGLADADLDAAAGILGCLFQGAMVNVAIGKDVAGALGVLEDAARRLLAPVTNEGHA